MFTWTLLLCVVWELLEMQAFQTQAPALPQSTDGSPVATCEKSCWRSLSREHLERSGIPVLLPCPVL